LCLLSARRELIKIHYLVSGYRDKRFFKERAERQNENDVLNDAKNVDVDKKGKKRRRRSTQLKMNRKKQEEESDNCVSQYFGKVYIHRHSCTLYLGR
jgi:hypothetical protein